MGKKQKPLGHIIEDCKRLIVRAEIYKKLWSVPTPLNQEDRLALKDTGRRMDDLAKYLVGVIMRNPKINRETKMDLLIFCTDTKCQQSFDQE